MCVCVGVWSLSCVRSDVAVDLGTKHVTVQLQAGIPVPSAAALVGAVRGAGFEGSVVSLPTSGSAPSGDDDDGDLFGLGGSAGATSAPTSKSGPAVGPAVLVVPGMMCMRNCGTKVKTALMSVPGVAGEREQACCVSGEGEVGLGGWGVGSTVSLRPASCMHSVVPGGMYAG